MSENTFDAAVQFTATFGLEGTRVGDRPRFDVEAARKIVGQAFAEAEKPGRWSWIEFSREGIVVHWLELKSE